MALVHRYVAIYPSGSTDPNGTASQGNPAVNYSASYTSMSTMEAGEDSDLTTGDGTVLHVEIIDSDGSWATPDGETVTFDGWKTGRTSYNSTTTPYVEITAYGGARSSNGLWDTGAYIFSTTAATTQAIIVDNDFSAGSELDIDFNYIQVQGTNEAGPTSLVIVFAGADHGYINFNGCYLRSTTNLDAYDTLFTIADDSGAEVRIKNCICGDPDASGGPQALDFTGTCTLKVYNCTFFGSENDCVEDDDQATFTMKNCAVFNNVDDFQGCTGGTFTYCANDDDDSVVTSNRQDLGGNAGGEWTAAFTDYTTSDLRVKAGGKLDGTGIGQASDSEVPTYDIAGTTRAATPCIGAFEYVSGGEDQIILPAGITSGIGVGAHTLSLGTANILLPGGVSSGLGLGTHTLGLWHTLLPAGVSSGIGLGSHTLSLGSAHVLLPGGAVSGVGLGPHTLSLGTAQVVLPNGTSSGLGLGSHTLTVAGLLILYPTGIASGLGLGAHTLSLGSANVLLPDGVPSGLGLGAHTLATGSANILLPDGAVSGLGLGIHTLTSAGLLILYPQGVKSGIGLGSHTLSLGTAQIILPDGTISGIGIGPPVIGAESALILLPTGLASGLGLGLLTLSGPASLVPKPIEVKLYEALIAHGALTALVASSIYPVHAMQGATLPSVVYDRVSGIRITSLSGYSNLENPLFQFDVYSENLDDLADIQDAIIGALAAATTFKAIPSTSPWDDWDDEVGLYRRVFDVSIWNKE